MNFDASTFEPLFPEIKLRGAEEQMRIKRGAFRRCVIGDSSEKHDIASCPGCRTFFARSLDSRGCNELAAIAYRHIWRLIVQSVLSSVPIALQYGSDQLGFTAFNLYHLNVRSRQRWADQTPATKANWEWVVLAICLHLVEAIAWEHGTDKP